MMVRRRWLDEADVGLILVTIFIFGSIMLPIFVFLQHLGALGCGNACDSATSWWAALSFLLYDGILFLVILPVYVMRANRWARSWWVPAVGIIALVIGALIAYVIIRIAIPTL